MYPAYRWTDSYPHHTNPPYYPPNHDPRAKETDRGTLNSPYYPWPYASSNHCYPIPQSCHSCCNHSYFGGPYSFTSPYPHYPPPPPPPPFHSHGFYPPFPGAHPAYSFPPPHYSKEQPRYDYDKNTPTPHHCCGCEKKSNIEPQEPEVDKKTNESLVPFLKNYPHQIMWVPPSYTNTESNANEKEKEKPKPLEPSKQGGENDKIAQDQHGEVGKHFPFPIFWLPFKNDEVKKDNLDEKTRKNDEVEAEKSSSKHGGEKVTPVKQGDAKEEKKTENGKEEKKVSSQKTSSKLPPVCLRIDPLPRKKNTSRSPSPPGDKERLKRSKVEDSNSVKQQTELHPEGKEVEKDSVVEQDRSRSIAVEGSKAEKKRSLSENEAAVMIQSVYRGFEVRKSQPLMKLRQITELGKQVVELRNRIHDLESTMDNKQKLVIGETIMSLLLKLDTIQGLHPVVRDVRKSVAKELVSLQEKLDSLTFVNSETLSEEKKHGGEIRDAGLEPQVESQNEEDTGELNRNEIPTLEELESEKPVDSMEHEKAQSDCNEAAVGLNVEDHKVEDADPADDMKTEHLVEQSSGELINDQVQMAVETEQPVDDVIQEESDQVCGADVETMESDVCVHDDDGGAEARDSVDHEKAQSDRNEPAVGLSEVEAADPPDDMKMEHLVEQSSGELNNDQVQMAVETEQPVDEDKSGQVQSKSGTDVETMETDVCEHDDDGSTEARGINLEPQVGFEGKQSVTDSQVEMVEEVEPPEESDQTPKNVDSMEDLSIATVEVETDVGTVETREVGKEVVGNRVEDLVEPPMVDDVDGGSKEVLTEDIGGGRVSSGGDKKVMEENEKLRAAVEELMKAGSEQASVIRELTGRVKDLEKELVKKKRRKFKKSSRRLRGSVVEEE